MQRPVSPTSLTARLSESDTSALERVAQRYAVAITPAMAGLMGDGQFQAAVARQFLPDPRELDALPDELDDPTGDDTHEVLPGLIHRYRDRVLLKPVSVCAVYCRFCFRRERVGPDAGAPLPPAALDAALAYIHATPEVWEVIVSGGDPLVLSARRVADLTARLAGIDHVKVLRWHSRVPVVAPDLVTPDLVASLRSTPQAVYVAVHANHPAELTPAARAACARLADGGVALVSQSVLLAGVNDDAATLEALMRAFVEARVKPYYLHHLDRAPGTSHFRASIADGQRLMREMRGRVSGLAQPHYVLDIPGGHGKVPIGSGYIVASEAPPAVEAGTACGSEAGGGAGLAGTTYIVEDPAGCRHCYRDEVPPPRKAT